MEILTNNILANPVATFSLGTFIGATSVYYALRARHRDPPTAVPMEERDELSDPRDEYRLIMAIRNDLKMQKGKAAAQCGHAAVAAYAKALKYKPKTLQRWLNYGGTKIAVRVDSEQELLDLDRAAKARDVLSSIVRDAGQTQVAPGSRTVIAVGPAPKSVLDDISGHLKLY